ncbi:hypothetical protein [Mesorhizobium sp. M1C.F.Ca.ET.212.01.1.1]|uniref:hypothetical protein n=1 Tax=Mesorhizobium sp. M1C.F.Ca.ET.212.01.1.1 TaxID=2500527 RepID=UPI001AEE9BB3|nr:hypothetical protein [Mesorhizobium sp. M1C.F.Ca.ET.212.01.1.1]
MLYRALALAALVLATAGLFSCQQSRVSRATIALDKANAEAELQRLIVATVKRR